LREKANLDADDLLTTSIFALSVMGVFAPTVKADEWNKKTNITINQPIEVEGTVLPAGSYVLKLVDSPADRSTVWILNAAENHVIATVFAIPIYRTEPPDKSELRFSEPEAGRPLALHSWFYAGDSIGLEFREVHGASTVAAAQGPSTTVSNASSN
jgi:Protein of unknown function (DUF2911)